MHNRRLLLLSDDCVQELADIPDMLNLVEDQGAWPERASEVAAVVIPNANGRLRPILL